MADLKFKDFINDSPVYRDKFSATPLDKLPLTMAYVPFQCFGDLYTEHEALKRGTLFADLDKPFYGKFTGEKWNG